MNARFLNLNAQDAIKGAVVAALTTVLTALVTALNSGHMPVVADLRTIGMAGLSAGVAYLVKNLLTNSKNELCKAEPAPAPEQPKP